MTENTPTEFGPESNPADYTVDQVNAYLATASDDERARVLGLEDGEGGKGRATVTREFDATPEQPEQPEPEQPEQTEAPEPGPVSTKGTPFDRAAEQMADVPERTGVFLTSTDKLAAEGKTKGYTFAEQAEQARDLYGTGR